MATDDNTETYGWQDSTNTRLLDKLKMDLKTAMRNKDNAVKDAIRVIMSEFPRKITLPITLESGKKSSRPKKPEETTNDEVIDVIRGLVKSEKTTLELKKLESSEYLEILESYLPKMASKEEITAWIKDNIDFSKFKSGMQAMGPIMKHFGKLADGNLVKESLKDLEQQ